MAVHMLCWTEEEETAGNWGGHFSFTLAASGLSSWDSSSCHVDLEKELEMVIASAPHGEELKGGKNDTQGCVKSDEFSTHCCPAQDTTRG